MKWIVGKYTDDDFRYNDRSYKCSNCGHIETFPERFCPNCGERGDELYIVHRHDMHLKGLTFVKEPHHPNVGGARAW